MVNETTDMILTLDKVQTRFLLSNQQGYLQFKWPAMFMDHNLTAWKSWAMQKNLMAEGFYGLSFG